MSSESLLRFAKMARFALIGALLSAAACAGISATAFGGAQLALPGPAPRPRPSGLAAAVTENAKCEGCHQDIAKEWRGSLHQQAWHDPVFQKALAIEPEAFCRGCHAPEADASGEPPKAAQDVGVGCVTCHLQGSDVVGTRAVAAKAGAHAVVADPRLGATDACASCHQFEFPRAKGLPMQNTVREHASSSFSAVACQGCHMPAVDGPSGRKHRSHDFSVMSDKDMIRSAATARALRSGSRAITVSISAAGAGHSFPTGDMFRRLEVRAEAVDADGLVIARAAPVHLARVFGDHTRPEDGAVRRVELADTRIPPPGAGPAREVELELGVDTRGLSVRWTLAYQRMDHAMAASFGVEQARDEIEVVSGVIEPVEELKK